MRKEIVTCGICGKIFPAYASAHRKFCSTRCTGVWTKREIAKFKSKIITYDRDKNKVF